jgi:hypothetical protein
MKQMILPLGNALTLLPMTSAASSQRAGAGFELYRPIYVSTRPKAAWRVLAERLRIAEREATRLNGLAWPVASVADVLKSVATQASQLAKALEDQFASLSGG